MEFGSRSKHSKQSNTANVSFQTSAHPLSYSPDPCDGIASCCLRPLLQKHCSLHTHPRLCDSAGHRSGTDAHTRPLLFYARSRHDDSPKLAFGDDIRIFTNGYNCAEPPPPISHSRRDCAILLPHPAAQILATSSASIFALLSSAKWAHNHRLQLWSHSWWHNLAHSARTRIYRICCGLEPGPRECICWSCLAWWCRRWWR